MESDGWTIAEEMLSLSPPLAHLPPLGVLDSEFLEALVLDWCHIMTDQFIIKLWNWFVQPSLDWIRI